jgi:hypothetical protein
MDALEFQAFFLHNSDGSPTEPPAICSDEVEFVLLLLPELLGSDPLPLLDMGLQIILQSTILDNRTHSEAVPKYM